MKFLLYTLGVLFILLVWLVVDHLVRWKQIKGTSVKKKDRHEFTTITLATLGYLLATAMSWLITRTKYPLSILLLLSMAASCQPKEVISSVNCPLDIWMNNGKVTDMVKYYDAKATYYGNTLMIKAGKDMFVSTFKIDTLKLGEYKGNTGYYPYFQMLETTLYIEVINGNVIAGRIRDHVPGAIHATFLQLKIQL